MSEPSRPLCADARPRSVTLFFLGLFAAASVHAECTDPVAHVVSIQGQVDFSAAGRTEWHPAQVGQGLCAGELVTVRRASRAAVQFEGDVLTRLDQYSTLEIAARPKDGDVALGLKDGIAHVISRLRKRVEIISPVVNALVEGTEFTVLARDGRGQVIVAEGHVRVSNPSGEVRLAAGEAVEAGRDEALRAVRVAPLTGVQWAIHYPLVVWPKGPSLHEARAMAMQGRYRDALDRSGTAAEGETTAYRANLLLALGRYDDADALVKQGEVAPADRDALRAIVAMAQGRLAEARTQIDAARAADAGRLSVSLAESYVLQAEGRLAEALAIMVEAAESAPANPVAWARRAELELMLADAAAGERSAQRALSIDAGMTRAQALVGMAQLLSGRSAQAQATLEAAIARDPDDPLAHHALGLSLIRQGQLEPGRRQLEVAVLLDPSNVEYRSILARAYMAENKDARAQAQLDLAGQIDPASPTPYFFEAQRLLNGGDVLGAIEAGQQALALNDNRLSLRSPELLATDKAARATTLGSAYQNAGFESALKRVASDAVEADPASGPAHRLMARAYEDDNRLESARVSEQFQSFIFGDMGQPMVMPQDLVTAMPVLDGARAMSMYEAAALFDPKPYRFEATGLIGSQESWGTSVMASAGNQDLQASVGHFDYRSDGFSENGEVDLSTTRAEFRGRLTDNTIVFADLQHKDTVAGDVTQSFFTQYDEEVNKERSDLTRIGFRYRPSAEMSFVLVGANESGRVSKDTSASIVEPTLRATTTTAQVSRFDRRELAGRLDWAYSAGDATLGFSLAQEKRDEFSVTVERGLRFIPLPFPPFGVWATLPGDYRPNIARTDASQERVFGSVSQEFGSSVTVHGRVNYVSYRHESSFDGNDRRDADRVLPSVGVTVHDLLGAEWRAAIIQDLSYAAPGRQSIEPTRFAGFDALFDDVDGTRYRRWALGLTRPLGTRATLGAEWSMRKASVPTVLCRSDDCMSGYDERRHSVYASFQASRSVGFETGWRYTSQRSREDVQNTFQPMFLRTESLPVRMFVQWPSNWRFMVEALRVRQHIDYLDSAPALQRENSAFWLANLRLQYGAPGARWGVAMDVRNLFDQNVRVQETDLVSSEARTPLWYPERSLTMTVYTRF